MAAYEREGKMKPIQRLIILVGSPGSGKDLLIRAIDDLGAQHAQVIAKHTSRKRWPDDRKEMICSNDFDFDLISCDIKYDNYGDKYGINSTLIWSSLQKGVFPVVVISNAEAINQLHEKFGDLVVLVYVHSEMDANEFRNADENFKKGELYVERRVSEYQQAFDLYLKNFRAFDHVLINCGDPEDLYDQIFRLFRAYERGDLFFNSTKSTLSKRFWDTVDKEQSELNN